MNMQGLHYDLDSLFPESPDFLQEEEFCLKDYDNIRRLYPKWTRFIAKVVEEYIDRYEYEGSILYQECPDEISVYEMARDIFYMLGYDETEDSELMIDMIRLMVCNEIYMRRRRHERFCRKYHLNR